MDEEQAVAQPIRVEPSAEFRDMARGMAAIFNALVEVGFTRAEAIRILTTQQK